jgi:hypothetical protein
MRDLALFHREEAGTSLNHSGFPAAIGAVNNDNVTAVDFQIERGQNNAHASSDFGPFDAQKDLCHDFPTRGGDMNAPLRKVTP